MSQDILDEINSLIKKYFDDQKEEEFIPGKTKIPLAVPQFGSDEVIESVESLISTWVTMGKKVKTFESQFRDYVGQKEALMVNSGSSANLLALSALSSPNFGNRIKPGDEIICPAVTWSTSVYPILNVGAKPVLVDVDLNTLNVSPETIENAITPRTKAIMAVHLMGNPCQTDKIKQIADKREINLIEDCCEAHGAKIGNKSVGSFGICSTFSFFLSHHITTVEGGMVLTNNDTIFDIATAQRAHGWIREMRNADKIAKEFPDVDKRFLFYETGFNLRPTEIQGAFGIHQMKKLDGFVKIRRNIAKEWNESLNEFKDYLILPEERNGTTHSYFAYPITIKENAPFSRKEITEFLESKLIETRPIAGGNLTEQPSAKLYDHKVDGDLGCSKIIMKNSFFIGIHTGIKKQQQEFVKDTFNEFISERVRK
jgi:CDP-6-deoxy-D-xylo-4-hexulose-3-dehydrase